MSILSEDGDAAAEPTEKFSNIALFHAKRNTIVAPIGNTSVYTTSAKSTTPKITTVSSEYLKSSAMIKNNWPDIPGLISMDKVLTLPPYPTTKGSADPKKPMLSYSQRRDYESLIYHEDSCYPLTPMRQVENKILLEDFNYENDVFLLMVVKSLCASRERRSAVRQTWGNVTWAKHELGVRIRLMFLLGRCENQELQEQIHREDELNSDILQWNFFDSFRNLTLKDCLYLQWFARNCRNVPYIFKGDDDVFVNTMNIVKYLKEVDPEKRQDLFVGSLLVNSPRILDPSWKYYVSDNLYPGKFYPPYVSGGGFLMSGDLAVRLFVASLKNLIIPIDDAFIGILLKSINVEPQGDRGFRSWGMKNVNDCKLTKIKTYHKVSPEAMIDLWNDFMKVDMDECEKDSNDI